MKKFVVRVCSYIVIGILVLTSSVLACEYFDVGSKSTLMLFGYWSFLCIDLLSDFITRKVTGK